MTNKFKRKLNKLAKNPSLFLKDMYFKHSTNWKRKVNVKHDGTHDFTIVTAVYNVEKYLNDFFDSIVKQSLNFKKHIQIICIDDGSTDKSAEIIKNWQKKYPNNIHYFYKENGGQASARNLGLEHVKTEWVTFIDPDDFLNNDYFYNIDQQLSVNKNIKMVVCNLIFFMEQENIYKDTHPLKYRFKNKVNKLSIKDLKDCINLSVASSFFKVDLINKFDIRFDHNVKPNFEDGKFIADYQLYEKDGDVLFLKDSHYLYRKRGDSSSTLDQVWKKPEKFYDVLKYGYLDMLSQYHKINNSIPEHVQRTVIYDMVWYVRYLLDQEGKTYFLTEEQKINFHKLVNEIFEYIDVKTIQEFNLIGTWWLDKAVLISGFKGENLPSYFAYIENIDREKEQIYLSYFVENENVLEQILINNEDVLPVQEKVLYKTIVGKTVLFERRIWISYKDLENNNKIKLFVNNKPAQINLLGKWFKDGFTKNDILYAFEPTEKYKFLKDSWIIMDRDMQADDNGEHFYRYISKQYPEQEIYFALNPKSHDWERLSKEGFNLLEYGSEKFENELCKSSKIISSHADEYIENYFNDHYSYTKKFVFLQHGITKDNLSNWLNKKRNLRLTITATNDEYHSIADKNSPYKFNAREVALTGLPRHDALLKGAQSKEKTILIMPTWRDYIVGRIIGKGFTRNLNANFKDTVYYEHWHHFLNSQKLKELANNYGYKVIFAPHANIEPYLPEFHIPEYINIWRAKDGKIQSLFQNSTLMITDYSSVAFEMAYLGKTVLYYQFDKELVFSGGHTTQTGYFKYEEHAFGPVVYNEDVLINELEIILKNSGLPTEPYATRIDKTFSFRDGNNCERVYQAIKALDEPDTLAIDTDILTHALQVAYENKAWALVESRSAMLLEVGVPEQQEMAKIMHLEALVQSKKNEQAEQFLLEHPFDEATAKKANLEIALAQRHWADVNRLLLMESDLVIEQKIYLLQSYIMLEQFEQAKIVQKNLENVLLDGEQALMVKLWGAISDEDWQIVVDLQEQVDELPVSVLKVYLPQLLLARAYRKLGLFDKAHSQLVAFEKHSAGLFDLRLEIAKLALARQNYGKAITQLDKAFNNDIELMNEKILMKYLSALWLDNKIPELDQKLSLALEHYPNNEILKVLSFNVAFKNNEWQNTLQIAEALSVQQKENLLYQICLSYYRLGKFDELEKCYVKPTIDHNYEYWELIAEFALLIGDEQLRKYCYRGMIAIFPNKNKQQNLAIFERLSQ